MSKDKNKKKSAVDFSLDKDGKLKREPSDEDVDEMLDLAKNKNFEPGIYNFCNRWCEKCPDTAKCYLFASEELRKEKMGTSGKESSDEDWSEEMMYNLKVTKKLLKRTAEKDGLNIDKAIKESKEDRSWDRHAERRYDNVKCLQLAKDYMKAASKFLKDYYQSLEQYRQEFHLELEQDDIKDQVEVITWYHTFLVTKIWRCLYERGSIEKEDDEELKEMIQEDFKKFLKLVEKCFQESRDAISFIAKKRNDYAEAMAKLLAKLNTAEVSFREEFKLPQGYNVIPPSFNNEQIEIMKKYSEDQERGLEMALSYLTNHPDDKLIYGMVGDMYMNLGEFKKAIDYLETGAKLNPNDAIIYFLLGVALAKTGRFNKGLDMLKRAQELQPEESEVKRNLGWVTAMRGRFLDDEKEITKGREILVQIVRKDPKNVLAMTDLGQSFLMAHDFESAAIWMERAINLEPDNGFVKMIHKDVIEMRAKYKDDKGFQKFIEQQKVVKAYSGPPAKTPEEMDDHVAKQFEIEEIINQLNSGNLSKEEVAKVMAKLNESGMVGQVTAITDPNSPDAKVASEYIRYHQKVNNIEEKKSKEEVEKIGNKLFTKDIDKEDQKRITIILAHQGTELALEVLKEFAKKVKGNEMKVWLKMAIDECQAFLKSGKDGPGMFFNKV